MNFGGLFYDLIVNTISLNHFYLEIYVRLFFTLMRKIYYAYLLKVLAIVMISLYLGKNP